VTESVGRQTIGALVLEENLARVRNERAADEIEQSRLPRSVRPHDAKDLACFNGQADALNGGYAAESFGDVIEMEKRH